MSEHERMIMINAPAEEVFRYVTSLSNFAEYLPTVQSARPESTGRVALTGVSRGHQYETTGSLRVEEETLRMSWDSDDHPGYQGWLEVRPGDTSPSLSELVLSISGPPAEVRKSWPDARAEPGDEHVQARLMEVLAKIKDRVEALAGSV